MSPRPHLVLASFEVWPFVGGGGIGRGHWNTARALAGAFDVTILTTARFRDEYAELVRKGDPRLPGEGIEFAFAPEPDEHATSPFRSHHHQWSAHLWNAVRDLEPDLVEFPDYQGEGFVTLQAKVAGAPELANTTVVVRVHTTAEMALVLDSSLSEHVTMRTLRTLERYCLRHADVLAWPGGDVLETYRRFYGGERLAPERRVPLAFPAPDDPAPPPPAVPSPAVRLLYFGRLERRKGVENLVRALRALRDREWELTLVGGDTDTGPTGTSMRAHLEALAGGDERFTFVDHVPHSELQGIIDEHHVVVSPSLWECWSNVVREALARNRPVVATPTGGVVEVVVPGRSGWLTADTSEEALRDALAAILEDPAEALALIECEGPLSTLRAALESVDLTAHYRELAQTNRTQASAPSSTLVSCVIVDRPGDGPLEATVESIRAQTGPATEILLGYDVDRVPPSSVARDAHRVELLGISPHGTIDWRGLLDHAHGEHVLVLPAGAAVAPSFLERAAAALAHDPELGYATAWSDGTDASAVPLGNFARLVHEWPVAATAALVRRDLCVAATELEAQGHPLTSAFFVHLQRIERYGAVIPERLVSGWPLPAPSQLDDEPVGAALRALVQSRPSTWEPAPPAGSPAT